MKFNLLDLHDPINDTGTRKLLRIYSVVPRFSNLKEGTAAEQAIRVTDFLNRTNVLLKKNISPKWKDEWIRRIGHDFSQSSCKDWFIGRGSIPLVAIEKLKTFGLETEVNHFLGEINYVSSTTGDVTRIPEKPTLDLLYLCGIILGDGSLPITKKFQSDNLEYKLFIFSGDKENLIACQSIFINLFSKRGRVYFKQNDRGSSWVLELKGKTIYRFFKNIMKIPNGDKSGKAHIPQMIKSLPSNFIVAFLAGMVDSDIGKHGHGMGATFKSKRIVQDLVEELGKLGILAKNYGFHYKNGMYIQHDFSIPKGEMKKFKDVLEQNYLPKRADRLKTIYSLAGVP